MPKAAPAQQNKNKQFDSWKDAVLHSNIQLNNSNQTYDILYMVERTEKATEILSKFYYGSKLEPLNEVKPVAYHDVLQNIKEFSATPLAGQRTVEQLYNLAASECNAYLGNNSVIPIEWMAALIKLHIMFLLDRDVLKVNEINSQAKDIQDTQKLLIEGDKKSKVKVDPCNPRNVCTFRKTTMLKSYLPRNVAVQENIIVPSKHMFFVIIGFYDYKLFQELFTYKVSISGFVELLDTEEKCSSSDPHSIIDFTVCEKDIQLKKQALTNFWNKFYNCFDTDNYLDCLDNTFHMAIGPFKFCDKNESLNKQDCCLDVFLNICADIVKLPDVQRSYANYIRNLKICEDSVHHVEFETKPDYCIYKNIFNWLPPECFNVQVVLDALLDQVDHVVSKHSEENLSIFHKVNVHSVAPKFHCGIKSCAVDVFNQNNRSKKVFRDVVEENYSKMSLTITRSNFLVEANNDIHIKISPYSAIRSEYLKRNQLLLEKCRSRLLWKEFDRHNETSILTSKYHMKKLSDDLDISTEELQYLIHIILYTTVKCPSTKPLQSNKFLNTILPPFQDSDPVISKTTAYVKNISTPVEVNFPDELNIKIPQLKYSENPNVYESKNLANYKWYEKLPIDVMLQELYKAEQFYLCLDYGYSAFDDTILLRFHNNLDDFGINKKTWHQSLRTYLGIKEFFKYIVREDSQWLQNQEKKSLQNFEIEQENFAKAEEQLKQKVYPKLEFSDLDFVLPGSFKAKRGNPRSGIFEVRSKGQIKSHSKLGGAVKSHSKLGAVKSPSKLGAGKSHSKLGAGKSHSKLGAVTEKSLLEKLAAPTEPLLRKKLSVHCAKTPPYSFFAYDTSKRRIHLTGSTIVFYSQDGVSLNIDQTRFSRLPETMSIKLTTDDHSLIIHKNDRTWIEPFTFHFCLSDYTIIAFAKPYQTQNPEEKLCDSICRKLKDGDLSKRQNLFFISDKRNYFLKCFNIPFVTKKQLILSEELLPSFLLQLKKRKIPFRQPIAAVSTQDVTNLEVSDDSKRSITLSDEENTSQVSKRVSDQDKLDSRYNIKLSKKVVQQSISKYSEENENSVYEEEEIDKTAENVLPGSRKSINSEEIQFFKKSNAVLLKEIQKAVESQMPIFKICSSRLHRSEYVKRVKSYVEIPVGPIVKRVLVKPRIQKTSRKVEISKLLPVKPIMIRNNLKYEMKLCLPSGLNVETIPGFGNDLFYIRQSYSDRGPQCNNIANESARTYMPNGTLLVKKADGNFDMFSVNGQIVNCTLPMYKEKVSTLNSSESTRKTRKCYSLSNLTYLHAYGTNSTKFKRYFQRVMNRLRKHMIDNTKAKTFTSYNKCLSRKLKISPETIYLLQSTIEPFTKFSLVSSDGKKLKISRAGVMKEQKFDTSFTNEYRYEELFFDREDGTRMIFNRESELAVQFPDGTRISSRVHIERDLINVFEVEPTCYNNKCNAEVQISWEQNESSVGHPYQRSKSETFREANGWVSIFLNVKFEHPSYGTILFDGFTGNSELILPGNLKIGISKEGQYNLEVSNRISASITTTSLIIESQLCNACLQKCTAVFNIKPLYDKLKRLANSSKQQFIKVTDSFCKKFTVNYDGHCFSNTNYIRGRYNSVHCPNHNVIEHQKLLLLTRNLNGCKFWDVNAYRKYIHSTMDEGRTILKFHDTKTFQRFFSTTFNTKVYEPIDEKYLLPFEHPNLELTKSKVGTTEVPKPMYIKKRDLKLLPEATKIGCVYNALHKFEGAKDANEEKVCSQLSELVENLLDQNNDENEECKIQQEKLQIELIAAANKLPIVSMEERWIKWKQEVDLYTEKIRKKDVPKYDYASEKEKDLINDSTTSDVTLSNNSSVNSEVNVSLSSTPAITENLIDNMDGTENSEDELIIVDENNVDFDQEITSKEDLEENTYHFREKTKKEELFEIPLALEIFQEVIIRFRNFLQDVVADFDGISSESKVLHVAEKIYTSIIRSAEDLSTVPKEDLIKTASQILVSNISLENLNSLELHALLAHFTEGEKRNLCKITFDRNLTECVQKHKVTKSTADIKNNILCGSAYTKSAYELYSAYGNKDDAKISKRPANDPSRKPNFTVTHEVAEKNVEDNDSLLGKDKYSLRASYTNLIQKFADANYCEKCIDKKDFLEFQISNIGIDSSSSNDIRSLSLNIDSFPHISLERDVPHIEKDNIKAVDSESRLQQCYNFIIPESMRILFSTMSSKEKYIENATPYVERNPSLIENSIVNLAEHIKEKDNYEKKLKTADTCSLCQERISNTIKVDEKTTNNVLSVAEMLKHLKSGNFIVSNTHDTPNKVFMEGISKTHIIAKVGDADIQYLRKDCPPTFDPAVHVKERAKVHSGKIIRKTVGMVTQPGTSDNTTQT